MIVFLTGVPGSGKTYESVSRLYAYFGKDKKVKNALKSKFNINKDIKYFLTNIPYIKTEFSYDEKIDTSFKFDDFYEKILILHAKYLCNDTSESDLLKLAEELKIANTFFLIDECHNYLDKEDKALIFFFTYHRHFHTEILLITQNLSLVHYKYKNFCEIFVRAVPTSFNIMEKSFLYKYFPSSRMSAKELFKKVKIKKYDEIFKSYKSGGAVVTNNVIKKIFMGAIALFILMIILFNIVLNTFFKSEETVDSTVSNQNKKTVDPTVSYQNKKIDFVAPVIKPLFDVVASSDYLIFDFVCNKKSCFNDDYSFPFNLLKTLSDKKILKILN